jgi:hypothetical protein
LSREEVNRPETPNQRKEKVMGELLLELLVEVIGNYLSN